MIDNTNGPVMAELKKDLLLGNGEDKTPSIRKGRQTRTRIQVITLTYFTILVIESIHQ